MAATSTYPRSLHRWNVASGVLLALYVLNLAVFAVSVYNERLVRAIGLGAYTDERAWWPILVQVALGAAAFVTYYWPPRGPQLFGARHGRTCGNHDSYGPGGLLELPVDSE
jgi:hypothetical protein